VYNLPRAAHFDAEVMRVFQSIGLAEALAEAITPVRGMHFLTAEGATLFGFDAPDKPTLNGWSAGYMFYQPDLEAVLQAGVRRFAGVDVHAGHEVKQIAQSGDGVTVTVSELSTGLERVVTADYLWGCDGARSVTRKSMGAQLEDLEFDQPWLVVDTLLKREVELPERALQICDPARPITFIPSAGRHRRWEFMLMPGETAEQMEQPQRVRELIAPWVSDDDVEVIRAVVYSFHALIAHGWRNERLFLAGDAAHQMPPFLGQGMCAGIRDVNNLAWKLGLVRGGIAEDCLLDSYDTERAPHVRAIIQRAVQAGRIIQTTDPAVAHRRDEAFREAGGKGVAIGEEGGPIESRMPALVGGVIHGPSPAGQLFPQSRVTTAGGDDVLLDDVLGSGFALVVGKDAGELIANAGSWGDLPVRRVKVVPAGSHASEIAGGSVVLDSTGMVSGWLDRHGAALVRPDRYVYGTAGCLDELGVLATTLQKQLATKAVAT
jgi:3-(3-hydroxy-phenyl)propionate hydroxylase